MHHIPQAARAHPEGTCPEVFSAQAWHTIDRLPTPQRPPKHPPPVRTLTRMLAQLGGFLARQAMGNLG